MKAQGFYDFAAFRLDIAKRSLIRNGERVSVPPKVFDTLLFLLQNGGKVLEKEELMKTLWGDSFVEEGNLSQIVFQLRNILGDDRNGSTLIQTIPRRGYKFVAPVRRIEATIPDSDLSVPRLEPDYWSRHSPFRGLQVFEPEDSWLFFGRDSDTQNLLAHLRQSSTLAVVGNSGSGKSSLIRAGFMTALRDGRFRQQGGPVDSWRIAMCRPSGTPFDYLAEVLPRQLAPELSLTEQTAFVADCRRKLPFDIDALRNAIAGLASIALERSCLTRVLLVVDQFEEIFTLTHDQGIRHRYIDALLRASSLEASIPVHLLLVLRADFYANCLEHVKLSRCLEANLYNVPRMTCSQLREGIEKRLILAGAQAEAGLMDSVLDDVGSEPGDLALLEHALPGCG